MSHRVDIVLAVRDEEALFPTYHALIARVVRADWRLLVIYDTPTDRTLTTAQPIADADPRVLLLLNAHVGIPGAVRTGFAHTIAPAVFVTAVDLMDDIEKLDEMLAIFYDGDYTVLAPSRYMEGGRREAGGFFNHHISRLAGLSLFHLAGLPIHDATSGCKIYRKEFLDRHPIESTKGWSCGLELTVKAHREGLRIGEFPIVHRERTAGMSKFKLLAYIPHYLPWYLQAFRLRLARRRRP